MFALADCNNFFASCERVFRPDLEGKPVIVLSNNDGCAVARSNEAKALGIKMGDPLFKIKDIIEQHHVAVFSSNYALYGDMSRRVQEVLRDWAPAVEQYSIDESFLDLRGAMIPDLDGWAKDLSRTCRKMTGIPLSIGVAPTKTLAKIASKLCKKYPKLQGGCYMHRPQDIEEVLRKFPVEDVWGIGRRSVKKLSQMGVATAWVSRSCGNTRYGKASPCRDGGPGRSCGVSRASILRISSSRGRPSACPAALPRKSPIRQSYAARWPRLQRLPSRNCAGKVPFCWK